MGGRQRGRVTGDRSDGFAGVAAGPRNVVDAHADKLVDRLGVDTLEEGKLEEDWLRLAIGVAADASTVSLQSGGGSAAFDDC